MCIEDESLLANTTNFQVFMTVMMDKSTVDKRENVISVLLLLFPDYKTIFTPRTLVLNKGDLNIIIDENNFEIL
jgi:hypothetical protein